MVDPVTRTSNKNFFKGKVFSEKQECCLICSVCEKRNCLLTFSICLYYKCPKDIKRMYHKLSLLSTLAFSYSVLLPEDGHSKNFCQEYYLLIGRVSWFRKSQFYMHHSKVSPTFFLYSSTTAQSHLCQMNAGCSSCQHHSCGTRYMGQEGSFGPLGSKEQNIVKSAQT